MEKPKYLYKFVVPERIDILKNGLIRFTQPSALNDPFELQPIFDQLLPENIVQEAINPPFEYIEDALRRNYEKLTDSQKAEIPIETIISIVKQRPDLLKTIMDKIGPGLRAALSIFAPKAKTMLAEALNAKVGVLSLSEAINNPLLWAHYTDSHKGFVIEFNTDHNFFNSRRSETDEFYHLRKVKYRNRISVDRTLMDINGDDLLVTKNKDWEYESEWRILAPLANANSVLSLSNDQVFLFEIPLVSVSGIIFGSRSSSSLQEDIKCCLASIDSHQITLKTAVLNIENQSIEIVEFAT